MPLELLKKPPKNIGTKSLKEVAQPPSLLRDIFEGLVDTGLGAIGVGPDTKANRLGGLLGMALPIGASIKNPFGGVGKAHVYPPIGSSNKLQSVPTAKLGRYDNASIKASDIPAQNRLAMGMNPSEGIYDEAGRYLGAAPKVDPVFQAHVGSSRGKHKLGGALKVQDMEEAFLEKGLAGPSPSNEMIKQLLKKYATK